jgi:hypothetical protein
VSSLTIARIVLLNVKNALPSMIVLVVLKDIDGWKVNVIKLNVETI